MSERKYQFKNPKTPEEHVEALYEELSLSPEEKTGNRQTETLKDYVAALLAQLRKAEYRRDVEKETEAYSISVALGTLAVLGLAFLLNGVASNTDDWEWLDQHRFAIKLWGLAFAIVFVGVCIEQSSLFRNLWKFGFTKIFVSLAISTLFIFSTGRAGGLINTVFPVDPSALPFTRAIVAGLLAFKYSSPLLAVVALFAAIHAFIVAAWLKGKKNSEGIPLQSFAFLILALFVLFFTTRWINKDFSDAVWPAKVYRLAHMLDFNSKYECINLPKGLSVIFLGSDHMRVLADIYSVQTNNVESFVDAELSRQVVMPERFYVLPCEVGTLKTEP